MYLLNGLAASRFEGDFARAEPLYSGLCRYRNRRWVRKRRGCDNADELGVMYQKGRLRAGGAMLKRALAIREKTGRMTLHHPVLRSGLLYEVRVTMRARPAFARVLAT